jgi:hypothetical protein
MHNKTDNEMIYENHLNKGAIGDQQNSGKSTKYAPVSDLKNSNAAQWSGVLGRGTSNGGNMRSSPDLSSDEEHETLHIKGYGVMRVSQVEGAIKRLSDEISELISKGIFTIGNKADMLTVFADGYNSYKMSKRD